MPKVALASISLFLAAACNGAIPEGRALDVGSRAGSGALGIPVGTEEAWMMAGFTNISEDRVVIKDVILGGTSGLGEAGEVVRIELAPRDPHSVTPSVYGTYPPMNVRKGRCLVQPTHSVEGYEVEPGKTVFLLVHTRALAPGTFKIREERVVYEQDGRTYHQTVPFEMKTIVKKDAKPLSPSFGARRRCLEKVTLLPGWRRDNRW